MAWPDPAGAPAAGVRRHGASPASSSKLCVPQACGLDPVPGAQLQPASSTVGPSSPPVPVLWLAAPARARATACGGFDRSRRIQAVVKCIQAVGWMSDRSNVFDGRKVFEYWSYCRTVKSSRSRSRILAKCWNAGLLPQVKYWSNTRAKAAGQVLENLPNAVRSNAGQIPE